MSATDTLTAISEYPTKNFVEPMARTEMIETLEHLFTCLEVFEDNGEANTAVERRLLDKVLDALKAEAEFAKTLYPVSEEFVEV